MHESSGYRSPNMRSDRDRDSEDAEQSDRRARHGPDARRQASMVHALERGQQRLERGVAPSRIGRQPDRQDPVDRARYTVEAERESSRAHGRDVFVGGRATERAAAVKRLVERHAECELVGERVGGPAGVQLGRHVRRRSEHRAGLGQRRGRDGRGRRGLRRIRQPRQTEVADENAAVARHQDVLGLDVAVNDIQLVGRPETTSHLQVEIDDPPVIGARLRLTHPARHRAAVDQLRDDIDLPVDSADVVNGQHVGMRQRRQQLRLAQEAIAPAIGGRSGDDRGVVLAQPLDRHLSAQFRVERGKHDAGAPGAERLEQLVAPAQPARRIGRTGARELGQRTRATRTAVAVALERAHAIRRQRPLDEAHERLVARARRRERALGEAHRSTRSTLASSRLASRLKATARLSGARPRRRARRTRTPARRVSRALATLRAAVARCR